ncbi:MAG: LysR family transcriptional regulator [Alphaproteobacteria bacterium]|nr:LysR family transcriptional regulator [Alphaproteobacteria bacterium]
MDIDLARTFLAITRTGSFRGAAEQINVTQTAISARVRALEDLLGRKLFVRNKAGARLTPAGLHFMRHASALVHIWESARRQVALPPGRERLLSVGGELSLWNPLFVDWLVWMRRVAPQAALHAEVDTPARLIERVQNGTLDAAILYSPQRRPNLIVELLAEEKLVMVTSTPDGRYDHETYIQVDWGADFTANQQSAFPDLTNPAIAITLGPLALNYLLTVGGSGYFRMGAVRDSLERGLLFRVPAVPEFSHSIYLVHAEHDIADLATIREGFKACLNDAPHTP